MITASGILFVSPDNKILLLKRSGEGDHAKEWCTPGGKLEEGEDAEQAALREFSEECGMSYDGTLSEIFHTQDQVVDYTTFLAHVEEFTPKLDHEHTAFMWCALDDVPNKLHPAVRAMLEQDAVKGAILGDEVKADSDFKEGDHPRAENGQFGGSSSATKSTKVSIQKVHSDIRGLIGEASSKYIPSQQIDRTTYDLKDYGGFYGIMSAKHAEEISDHLKSEGYKVDDSMIDRGLIKIAKVKPNKDETRADAAEVITETDIAKRIRDKELTSPQKFSNVSLFALRISGTGVSYRSKLNEYVNRLPENYLSEEFLERCNGLPVIWIHPDKEKLDSESFGERVIGTICLPYIEGNEVWGIAKIWDDDAAQNMRSEQLSTSPGVVFQAGTNSKVPLKDGTHVLVEGKPSLLDHLAIVENGVWDKGGAPSGVLLQTAHAEMAEASRQDSADPICSTKGETTMAEINAAPAASAETEILSLLKTIAAGQADITARLEVLEAGKEGEEKADEGNLPAPILNPAPVKAPEVVEKPAIVADDGSKARLDAVESELAQLKANSARQDNAEEAAKFAAAQGRADAVEQAYGDNAPRPLQGDTEISYRQRLLSRQINRSSRWNGKAAEVAKITDGGMLAVIEEQVYADSMKAAVQCVGLEGDALMPYKVNTGTGHEVIQFRGKQSFVTGFAPPKMVSKINRKAA